MVRFFKNIGALLWQAISGFQEHNAGRMAAAIAFNGILSIAPLGVISVTIAGSIYGKQAAEGVIVNQLKGTVGDTVATAVQGVLRNAYVSKATVAATILAFAVLVLGGTRLIGALRSALNNIWGVQGRGGGGIKGWLIGKGVDIIAIFVLAGLLLITMLAQAASNTISHYFANVLPFPGAVLLFSGTLFSLGVATAVFMVIFRWLPSLRLNWRDVAFGGVLTAILFTFGNYALGLYLARSSPGSVFGAAGSFVVVMLWMSYSAYIVIFGVEVTRARWERKHGKKAADPTPDGMRASDA